MKIEFRRSLRVTDPISCRTD